MNTDHSFDLTTKEGKKDVMNSLLLLAPPGVQIAAYGIRKIKELLSGEATLDSQKKLALDLIEQARKSGAKSIKLTVDNNVGLSLQSEESEFPIKVSVGTHGKMTIEVVFK